MRRMVLSVVTACCLSGWLCLPLSAQGEGGVIVPWDAARDAPVKGGRFYLLATDARELPAGLRQRLLTEDPEKVLKATGRMLKPDRKTGCVKLPAFQGRAVICARKGRLFGILRLRGPVEGETRLLLSREIRLRVKAENASGKGVRGVPIALGHAEGGEFVVTAIRQTGRSGAATFRGLTALLEGRELPERIVTAGFPLPDPPLLRVDLRKVTKKGVSLKVPETAALKITLETPAGEPFAGQALVNLRVRPEGDDLALEALAERSFTAFVDKGVAVFPHLAPGLPLRVWVQDPNDRFVTVREEFEGPAEAGKEGSRKIVFGVERPALTGVLKDSSGTPLAGETLEADWSRTFTIRGDPQELMRQSLSFENVPIKGCVTDEKGRFRFIVDGTGQGMPWDRIIISRVRPFGGDRRPIPVVEAPLKEKLKPGVNDLGEVVLPDGNTVVAGLVLDDEGHGIAGVGVQVAAGRGEDDWNPIEGLVASSDEDGLFTISGNAPRGKLRLLVAAKDHYLAEPAFFSAGESRLKVRLSPAGGLAGGLVLPDRVPARLLEVRVEGEIARTGAGVSEEAPVTLRPGPDGAFSIRPLRPGKGKLSVRFSGAEESLFETEVEVKAGETSRPSPLRAIDLKALVPVVSVTIKNAEGRPLPRVRVWAREGRGKPWRIFRADAFGEASLPGFQRPFEALVAEKGMEVVRREEVKSDFEVRLRPLKPTLLTVSLPEGLRLPKPPVFVKATLFHVRPDEEAKAEGPDPLGRFTLSAVFGADGKTTFEIPVEGTWGIGISVRKGEKDAGPLAFLFEKRMPYDDKNQVTVTAGQEKADLPLTLNRALLEAVITSMEN